MRRGQVFNILEKFKNYKDIELVTSSAENKFQIIKEKNIKIVKLPIKKKNLHYWTQKEILDYSFKAYKYYKGKDYDLIYAFFGVPCGFIAYLLKKPYIISLRGSDIPGFNERFGFGVNIVLDHYICLGDQGQFQDQLEEYQDQDYYLLDKFIILD